MSSDPCQRGPDLHPASASLLSQWPASQVHRLGEKDPVGEADRVPTFESLPEGWATWPSLDFFYLKGQGGGERGGGGEGERERASERNLLSIPPSGKWLQWPRLSQLKLAAWNPTWVSHVWAALRPSFAVFSDVSAGARLEAEHP